MNVVHHVLWRHYIDWPLITPNSNWHTVSIHITAVWKTYRRWHKQEMHSHPPKKSQIYSRENVTGYHFSSTQWCVSDISYACPTAQLHTGKQGLWQDAQRMWWICKKGHSCLYIMIRGLWLWLLSLLKWNPQTMCDSSSPLHFLLVHKIGAWKVCI